MKGPKYSRYSIAQLKDYLVKLDLEAENLKQRQITSKQINREVLSELARREVLITNHS
mgnify:CR=1 FL=1